VSSHAEEAEEAEKSEGFLRQSSASSAPSACQFFLRIRYDTEAGKTISKGTERNREQPEEQRKKCESPLFLWLSSAPLYLNLCFLAFDVRLVFFRIWYYPNDGVRAPTEGSRRQNRGASLDVRSWPHGFGE
jgi:hypothetical protein